MISHFKKNKYTDNRLAEELDLVLLTNDNFTKNGLPFGSLGTLISSYTGKNNPLYILFNTDKGKIEQAVSLRDFRVLNEKDDLDASIIVGYLVAQKRKKEIF